MFHCNTVQYAQDRMSGSKRLPVLKCMIEINIKMLHLRTEYRDGIAKGFEEKSMQVSKQTRYDNEIIERDRSKFSEYN